MKVNSGLSTQEVAEILNISKNTVYELIRRGELSSYRIGRKVRIDEIDIEAYKNKSRTSVKQKDIINVKQQDETNVEPLNE